MPNRKSGWLIWLKSHPALVVVSGPLLTNEFICRLYCSLFFANLRRPGRMQSEKLSFQHFGGREPWMRPSKAIISSWSLYMRWTWPSHLNCWTQTLFRMGVLYCSLLRRSVFETRSMYVMPAIRRSSYVSNAASLLESCILTVHLSQP